MSKPKPSDPQTRKTVQFPERLWEEIAQYREAEMIGSEAEALRRLALEALSAWRKRIALAAKPAPARKK